MNPRTKNTLFTEKKKCIINADLDGMLSGVILHNILGWEIIGFSMCNGRPNDELWLPQGMTIEQAISECVFIDLPVMLEHATVIDQHFNALDEDSINAFRTNENKINPNVSRGMNYISSERGYTRKYPFGTVHLIIAALEKYNYNINLNLEKDLGGFTSLDILLRADRIIGNTITYTPNCKDWAEYLATDNHGKITNLIKSIVLSDNLSQYSIREHNVEEKLKSLGCARSDGDCSNLLSMGQIAKVNEIIAWLSSILGLNTPSIPNSLQESNALTGERYPLSIDNYLSIKRILEDPNVFSYAIVNTRVLSVTRIKNKMLS